MASGDVNLTTHASLVALAANPANAASRFKIFSKLVSGVSQLFGRSSDGSVHQLTPSMAGAGMGEIYVNDNAGATVIQTQSTYTKVAVAAWTLGGSVMDFDMPSAGRLRYTGGQSRIFHCGATISLKGAAPNDVVRAVLYKNGVVNANNEFTGGTQLSAGIVEQKLAGTGDVTSTAIHVFVPMSTNDYLELGIANFSSTADLTVTFSNVFAVGMEPL